MPGLTKTCFRVLCTENVRTTAGGTFTAYNLTAANCGSRANDLKDDFEYFRIVWMNIYSIANVVTVGASTLSEGGGLRHAIAFDNSDSAGSGSVSTLSQMTQFKHYDMSGPFMRPKLRIGPSDLWRGTPFRWYQTTATGTPDATELSAGTVYYLLAADLSATSGFNVTQDVIVEGEIEFHTPVDLAISKRVLVPRSLLADPAVDKRVKQLEDAVKQATEGSGDDERCQKVTPKGR